MRYAFAHDATVKLASGGDDGAPGAESIGLWLWPAAGHCPIAEVRAVKRRDATELRLFTGEFSEGNLRLYQRLGYTETHRQATRAGYALVHMAKYRDRQKANPSCPR